MSPSTPEDVTQHPILFSGPMVRAILEGRKTQTRRLVKPAPPTPLDGQYFGFHPAPTEWGKPRLFTVSGDVWAVRERGAKIANEGIRCPYGALGERLWVRETWQAWRQISHERDEWEPCEGPPTKMIERYGPPTIEYAADERSKGPWTPSIHMPRWASRITLEVTGVRVERLHAITEDDARSEGLGLTGLIRPGRAVGCFSRLWDEINGKRAAWETNPWVWVVEFRKAAAMERAA